MSQLLKLLDDTPTPAFDLNFLGGMPAGLTYTNSSTERVYWDSTGTRRSAVANEPIFETLNGVAQGMRWEMEARTNLATNSEGAAATWTVSNVSDAGTSITGFSASLAFGDNSVQRTSYKTVGVTISVSYTVSVFVQMDDGNAPVVGGTTTTGDFSLVTGNGQRVSAAATITRIAGNLYRVSGATTASATNASAVSGVIKYVGQSARTFRIAGIQVEAAASASSYIPTAGSAVIRQPDVLTATSISPWYRQDEGTVVFEGIPSEIGGVDRGAFIFSDGSNNERLSQSINTAGNPRFFSVTASASNIGITISPALVPWAVYRMAMAYKENNCGAACNGGTVVSDTSAAMPSVNQLTFGRDRTTVGGYFMGYARRFQYYNTRLPNSQIQGLSRV